jgi:hypothetical protein
MLSPSARSDVPPFDADGRLSPQALQWADVAALRQARSHPGARGFVATGLFHWLNGGGTAGAIDCFDMMVAFGEPRKGSPRSGPTAPVDWVVRRLQKLGLKLRVELFCNETSPGQNLKALSRLERDAFTTHPLEPQGPAEGLRTKIDELSVGEAAILYVNDHSVITIVRSCDGLHLFDADLNSEFARTGLGMWGIPLGNRGEDRTADGRSHVHGAEAEAMLDKYLVRHFGQPVLIRLARD